MPSSRPTVAVQCSCKYELHTYFPAVAAVATFVDHLGENTAQGLVFLSLSLSLSLSRSVREIHSSLSGSNHDNVVSTEFRFSLRGERSQRIANKTRRGDIQRLTLTFDVRSNADGIRRRCRPCL